VTAGACPSINETNLPPCWDFTGGEAINLGKLQRKIDKRTLLDGPVTFTVSAGCSSATIILKAKDTTPTDWIGIQGLNTCYPGPGTNVVWGPMADNCGNQLQVNCENGNYVFRYNGNEVGRCLYTVAANYFYYRMTKDGCRFHSTWHTTRDDNPYRLTTQWVVFRFDCIHCQSSNPICRWCWRVSWDENWGDPNNTPNAETAGYERACN
jgi:hypothetical protein